MPTQMGEALARAMGQREMTQQAELDFTGDEFLNMEDLIPVKRDAAARTLNRLLAELEEFGRQNRWEDVLTLCYPVHEKFPGLTAQGVDIKVRAKAGFALGQLKRFDEAIEELRVCVEKEPSSFSYQSSLAFTAYNSLFAASNREIFLRGKPKADRIDMAHTHFAQAQQLRPDGVTNFYRQAMLFKKIESKPEKAIPLFERAIANWDRLQPAEREARHQERKNVIKSLFQLGSCLVEHGGPQRALGLIERCISEDEKSNYLSLVFKYFALGKVHFHCNRFEEARNALAFALQSGTGEPEDFVCELLARTYLALGKPQKAMETIQQVPETRRRPYVRWTEADICCALKQLDRAEAVLNKAVERDKRSRHKTLIRLARIAYVKDQFDRAKTCAALADQFFRENWGNPYLAGLFWQALAAYRLGDTKEALVHARHLQQLAPNYPQLDKLLQKLPPERR